MEHWTPYDDAKDYCGPEANPTLCKMIPRKILGVDTNRACYNHDQRYLDIKFNKEFAFSRDMADWLFWLDMLNLIIEQYGRWNPLRYLALGIAMRRYHAVRLMGAKPAE